MNTRSSKRTVTRMVLAVVALLLTILATATHPLGHLGPLHASADGSGVLLPDGTYTITWSATYDETGNAQLYDPNIATYHHTTAIHGVYSGVGTVIFHNTGGGSGTTTTMSVTQVHADLTSHFEEHDIHYPFNQCANQWTYDLIRDIDVTNPNQYLNVVSTIPMFRLEPFVAPDSTTKIHWPITSNPSSLDVGWHAEWRKNWRGRCR